jgi:5-aminolevulinate synthase
LKHQEVVAKVKKSFKKAGIGFYNNKSHIVPIIIGDPEKTRLASQLLIDRHSIFVQHINFPTVPRGTERLRITPTPAYTDQMIEQLTLALVDVFSELGIKLTFEEAA